MTELYENIIKQIKFNSGKNMFFQNSEIFEFSSDTINSIELLKNLEGKAENNLVDYTVDKVLEEFCRINQYYSFDQDSKVELKKIFSILILELKENGNNYEKISRSHYSRLKNWLSKSNDFAGKVYEREGEIIEPVQCAEYSGELQCEILRINPEKILPPLLDIGCGRDANFINYFGEKGIKVFGIDRFVGNNPNCTQADWLTFDFGNEKWGTITSNLGFSNHFKHHHFRKDGNFQNYAETFVKILISLKVGGSFYYAPDLPFIEQYLNEIKFLIKRFKIENYDFQSVVVRKLK